MARKPNSSTAASVVVDETKEITETITEPVIEEKKEPVKPAKTSNKIVNAKLAGRKIDAWGTIIEFDKEGYAEANPDLIEKLVSIGCRKA